MRLLAALVLIAVTGPPAAWIDGSRDELVQRAFLPSERNVHGEFRSVRRGNASCAQTLLYTTALRRAIQRFVKKERATWSEGTPGYEDSVAYIAALEQAKTEVLARFEARSDRGDPRQKMLIEFVLAPDTAFFAVYAVEIDGDPQSLEIARKEAIVVHQASRAYVEEEIRRMSESAFGDAEELTDSGKTRSRTGCVDEPDAATTRMPNHGPQRARSITGSCA